MRQASTRAGSRPAATRAVWRRRSSSASRPPSRRSAERLQVGAAARVARERGGGDLRHAQALLALVDLVADPGGVALALTQLVAVRRPHEPEMRHRPLPVGLHGPKTRAAARLPEFVWGQSA